MNVIFNISVYIECWRRACTISRTIIFILVVCECERDVHGVRLDYKHLTFSFHFFFCV